MKRRNEIYKKTIWKHLRVEVLTFDKYICQRCCGNYKVKLGVNFKKKMTKATLVHHHYEVEKYPEHKYSFYIFENGEKKRNLYSLCHDCHEIVHDRRVRPKQLSENEKKFLNDERWD